MPVYGFALYLYGHVAIKDDVNFREFPLGYQSGIIFDESDHLDPPGHLLFGESREFIEFGFLWGLGLGVEGVVLGFEKDDDSGNGSEGQEALEEDHSSHNLGSENNHSLSQVEG